MEFMKKIYTKLYILKFSAEKHSIALAEWECLKVAKSLSVTENQTNIKLHRWKMSWISNQKYLVYRNREYTWNIVSPQPQQSLIWELFSKSQTNIGSMWNKGWTRGHLFLDPFGHLQSVYWKLYNKNIAVLICYWTYVEKLQSSHIFFIYDD